MTPLTKQEYETAIAALRGDKFDKAIFDRAAMKLRMGSGIRPEGIALDREIPRSMKEWRHDQKWAIDLIDRHQKACDAAWREYWRIVSAQS